MPSTAAVISAGSRFLDENIRDRTKPRIPAFNDPAVLTAATIAAWLRAALTIRLTRASRSQGHRLPSRLAITPIAPARPAAKPMAGRASIVVRIAAVLKPPPWGLDQAVSCCDGVRSAGTVAHALGEVAICITRP